MNYQTQSFLKLDHLAKPYIDKIASLDDVIIDLCHIITSRIIYLGYEIDLFDLKKTLEAFVQFSECFKYVISLMNQNPNPKLDTLLQMTSKGCGPLNKTLLEYMYARNNLLDTLIINRAYLRVLPSRIEKKSSWKDIFRRSPYMEGFHRFYEPLKKSHEICSPEEIQYFCSCFLSSTEILLLGTRQIVGEDPKIQYFWEQRKKRARIFFPTTFITSSEV